MATCCKLEDTWWFCLLYSITFGGFVGLASFLNVFFLSQYGLTQGRGGQLRDALRDRRLGRCGRWAVISPTGSEASGC